MGRRPGDRLAPGSRSTRRRSAPGPSESFDRGFYPLGADAPALAVVLAAGDWSARPGRLDAPTLVIHGDADPLVPPSWGEGPPTAIPGAELS